VRRLPGRISSVARRPGLGSRRRGIAAAIGAIAVVVAAIVVILSSGLTGSTQAVGQPSKTQGATTVQRRDLIATDTESGTLSYARPQTVFNRMSGTVTWLPAIGRVIRPGQTLYKVDGAPVVLFDGTVPAYRDLSESDTDGPDIEQLKKNLVALGVDPEHEITINQTFDAATAAAVERWQAAAGETQTGSISLGQIVFLPGAQRVTAVDSVLGSNGGSSAASGAGTGSGSGSSTTASTIESPRPEFVSLSTSDASKPNTAKSGAWTAQSSADRTPTDPPCPRSGGTHTSTATSTGTTTPTATKPPGCKQHGNGTGTGAAGKSKSNASNPTLAALLALLKAETTELQHSRTGEGSSSGSSGGTRAGGTSTAAAGDAAANRSAGAAGAGSGSGGSGGSASSSGSGGSASSSGSGGAGSSGSGGAGSSGSGGAGGNAQPILQTTSTQLVVTVDLDATMQSEAVVHEPVTVELPDGSTVGGKIMQVSPVAQSSSSSSSGSSSSSSGTGGSGGGGGGSNAPSATVPVTITLTGHRHVTGLDQAAVSVNFEQQKATNVLSVPVSALLATAGGGYAIQEAAPPQRLIPVTPGLFAAGFVQISGAGVIPGLRVTDSQG
jgi:hypothetical protein